MSVYITVSDLDTVFGEANIDQWSNLDPDSTSRDDDRVDAAMLYGEEYVTDRFRGGPYTIPFAAVSGSLPRIMVDWMAKISGCWLFESRAGRVAAAEETQTRMSQTRVAVNDEMDLYLGGGRTLNLTRLTTPQPNCPTAH